MLLSMVSQFGFATALPKYVDNDRSKMFQIPRLYGIPDKIIGSNKVMYTGTSSTVLSTDGETLPFPILAGILQGDTLAPFLFIIVVDYVLRMSVDSISEKRFRLRHRKSTRQHDITQQTLTSLMTSH